MFHNKQALIGIYAGSSPANSQLNGFRITTTSGNVLIDWGDGTSQIINSNVPVDHTFYCPDYSGPQSNFWNNINPCS